MRAFNHLRLRARVTCRCCGDEDERFSHLSRCASIREVFDFFVIFASAFDGAIQMRAITIYLALSPAKMTPRAGWSVALLS